MTHIHYYHENSWFSEAATRVVLLKKSCLWKSPNSHRKTPVLESFYNKVADLQACNFNKKRPQKQVFSCEYCESFKNTQLKDYLQTAASGFFKCFCSFHLLVQIQQWNTRKKREIKKPKLTIKTPEQRHWLCYRVFIVNFKHLSHRFLVFQLLTLKK